MRNTLQCNVGTTEGLDLASLRQFSARLGANPLLVQASNSNTSIKVRGDLWIKASGTPLANAERDDSLVRLDLMAVRRRIAAGEEILAAEGIDGMRPSIETPMHAVLPHTVVAHVHSINTLTWAVRRDAESRLRERLSGLNWRWIPYVSSGIPLAREIASALAAAPETDVFVLASHGLVVCGRDCDSAQALLNEVERRLAIVPRSVAQPETVLLQEIARLSGLRLPDDPSVHALATDPASTFLKGGLLFPCQAIFLGKDLPIAPASVAVQQFATHRNKRSFGAPALVVEYAGVLLSPEISTSARATLAALAEVIRRTGLFSELRYLSESELSELAGSAHGYKAYC
ncbi:MAG TPA: class II aldolase/adducin family protein [Candidatus Aquilonibacter sp.]|nr:class II aldolase/adducin family protein [Candidatus Aquilonibacter sp.]